MTIALKLDADNFNIWFNSVLALVDYLVFIQVYIFLALVWWVILDCILEVLFIMLRDSGSNLSFFFIIFF